MAENLFKHLLFQKDIKFMNIIKYHISISVDVSFDVFHKYNLINLWYDYGKIYDLRQIIKYLLCHWIKYGKVQIAGEEKRGERKYISLWSSNYQITQLKLGFSYLKTFTSEHRLKHHLKFSVTKTSHSMWPDPRETRRI